MAADGVRSLPEPAAKMLKVWAPATRSPDTAVRCRVEILERAVRSANGGKVFRIENAQASTMHRPTPASSANEE